jgi:hypothetical protein
MMRRRLLLAISLREVRALVTLQLLVRCRRRHEMDVRLRRLDFLAAVNQI